MLTYCSPTDFVSRYDARALGDLLFDAGVRINSADLLTNQNILLALEDATGQINAAVLVAEKFAIADLQNMTGSDAAYLNRLTCDLAFCYLVQRRGLDIAKYPQYFNAQTELTHLRNGERTFNISYAEDAGLVHSQFPTVAQVADLNLAATYASRVFPVPRCQR